MTVSLSETRSILNRLGIQPNRSLGQNFLIQANVVQYSVEETPINPGDSVVEIGCGCGTLTSALVQAQARVFGVEKDQTLARYITETFPIDLVHGDALITPVGNFDLSKPYKVVSNLPYAIASVWLHQVLCLSRLPENLTLLVQKEAADRWLSPDHCKHFCPLGIRLQSAYQIKQQCIIHKRCFYPQPKIDSTLLFLQKKQDAFIFSPELVALMRDLFIHRRQQIPHICKRLKSDLARAFLSYLSQHYPSTALRAEEIPVEQWLTFARLVQENKQSTPKI